MERIFTNTENSKRNEPHKLVLNLSQRLYLRKSNKHYRWKNIRELYKKNKLKIIAPTCNDEFPLPDGSYSVLDNQDYIRYIIKQNETLTTISRIHVYIHRINNRLVFKIKDGYKLKLQTPKTMKLLGSTKKLIHKTKNGENVQILK